MHAVNERNLALQYLGCHFRSFPNLVVEWDTFHFLNENEAHCYLLQQRSLVFVPEPKLVYFLQRRTDRLTDFYTFWIYFSTTDKLRKVKEGFVPWFHFRPPHPLKVEKNTKNTVLAH